MTDPKDLPPDFTDLRRRAEAQIASEALSPEELSPDKAARLIHELRVHQVELEMQNDELLQSQAELEESRTKYADLYDFAPVGYLTLDARGAIVEANLTACTLLGVERRNLLSRFFSHFLVEADRGVFRQLMSNVLNLKERRGEVHLQDGGGNVRVMLLDILFLADAEGQDRRRVSLTDITELKHTQEELRLHKEDLEELVAQRTTELIQANEQIREANENLEALFTAAPLAIAEFDAEGKVIKINPACERMYGWSQEEVQGRPPMSIPQESPEESLAVLQRVLQGEPIVGEEIKQQHQDGSLFDASVFGAPLWDARGEVRGFVGLAEDITERKKLEEERYTRTQVLASMAEGVTVTDSRGTIIYTNPAFDAIFGYKPGELTGRHSNILNFSSGENRSTVEEFLHEVNATGRWTGEFHNCKKDGQSFYTLATISALTVGGKKLYISVQEDISERKKAREMLKRQAELLDLAHEAIFVRDLVGRITYWNRGAEALYGWTKAEAMGQVPHRLLATVFPQPLEAIETQVLEQGFWEGELTHTGRDGRVLVVDSFWTLKRDETGQPLAILEINRDLTTRRQAEAALQRSEARFRRLVEANVVGMAVSSEDRIVEANDEFLRLAGHSREELLAGEVRWEELTPREAIPQDARALYELRVAGAHTPYEKTLVHKDGGAVPVMVGGALLEEEPLSWVSFVLDISERKRLEDSLRQSEARFRAIFANASIGMATTDLTGRLQEFNAPVIKSLGYTPTELKNMDFRDLTHPDDLVADEVLFTSLVTGERDQYQVEKRFVCKDGRVLWGRVHMSLVRGPGGEPDFIVSLVEDITAQKESQAALAKSEARYRSLVDLSPDGIIVHARGRYVFANPAGLRLFGAARPEDLLGRRVLNLVHPDSVKTVRQKVKTGEHLDIREVKILRLDGQEVEVEVVATCVHYRGQPAVQVVIRDITKRKRAEREIRRLATFPELNPNPVLEVKEDGEITFANPAARRAAATLRLVGGVQALVPPNLQEIFAAAREGGPREYSFDLNLAGATYAVTLHLPHDLPTARLYALDITARKRAEAALREREARLSSLLAAAPVGIGMVVDRVVKEANQKLCQMTGYSREELLGQSSRLLYPTQEEFNYVGQEKYRQIGETGVGTVETRWQRKDGTVIDILLSSAPLIPGDPDSGTTFTALDITERKQAEAALKESEARYRAIGELIPFGIWTAAPDGGWEYISKSFLNMTGRTLEECQSLNWVNLLPQEDIKPALDAWQQCREIGNFWDHELKIRSKDGAWRTVISRGLPLADSQGRITSWVGLNLDISERKDMEEALSRAYDQMEERVEKRTAALRLVNEQLRQEIEERQEIEDRLQDSEARFTAFMEHLPGLAVMRDMEGRYLFATRAWEETMGLAPKAWRGKTLAELWTPERTAFLQKSDFEIISTGEPTEEVEVQVLSDGPHHFLTKRFPILGNDGLPYMVGAISIDITARQRAEQQVAETGRLYQVLSQVNEAIMRGRDQQSLFDQVCRILVEEGQFRLAWVGLTDPETQTVRVAAKYSVEEGYLDNLAISLKGGPRSKGPTGTAIRDNRSDVCNDLVTDPRMKPWRLEALAKGYGSSGAFPLHLGAEVVGAIMLYAPRPQFFTDKEITLLTSLADNLSFALESLDREDKRRRAEEEIRKQAALLDLAHDAIIVGDPGSKIVFWSRGAEETYGWRKAQALGAVTHDLLKTKFPSSKEDVDRELLQKGAWEGELLHTRADGNVITLASRQVLQKDDQGKPVAILEINRDITERHLAEEALAEQAMLVQDLYNKAPCGYHSLDSEGYFAQVNDTELAWLGYAREELVGRLRFSDLMTPDSRKLFEEIFPGFRARGWVKDLEYELIRKDGTILPVLLSATTVTDEAGNYLLSRSTMFDITGRKKADEALQESEKRLRYLAEQLLNAQENERKRLASELHDELGHALLALKLNLSSIEKKLLPEQQVIKEEVRAQLGYINEVIQDVRRLYHDLSPGDLEDLGLTKALGTLINDFAGHFPQVNWQVDLADMVGLFSLPVQTIIYRIIQEALTNIGKHAHPTIVTIFSKKENQQMHFVVRDNGIGFNIQELSSRDTARGLGLAAMQERLKMVGGSFEIQSREQEGTKLSFSIPVLPEGGKQ